MKNYLISFFIVAVIFGFYSFLIKNKIVNCGSGHIKGNCADLPQGYAVGKYERKDISKMEGIGRYVPKTKGEPPQSPFWGSNQP